MTSSSSNLEISVSALPDSTEDLSIHNELEIIKPALLYGDTTALYSPQILILQHLDQQGSLTPEDLAYFTRAYSENHDLSSEEREMYELLDALDELRKKPHRTPQEESRLQGLAAFNEVVHQSYQRNIRPKVEKLLKDAGYQQIRKAIKEGVLSVTPLIQDESFLRPTFENDLIRNFIDHIERILKHPGSYPLLDSFSIEVVKALITDGRLVESVLTLEHAKQMEVASQLMRRAPTFPKANVYDIIDIRKELRKPLTMYRAGTIRLAELVRSPVYGEEFQAEVGDLILKEIEPAILEIEEEIRNNKYLKRLTYQVLNRAGVIVSSGLGVGVAPLSDLPAFLSVAATSMSGIALAGSAAQILADVYMQRKEKDEELRGREMYFLVGLDRKLKERVPK